MNNGVKVCIIADGEPVNKTIKIDIWKSNVNRLRLVNIPTIGDIIKVYYNDGNTDELHFTLVDSIDGDANITDNNILFNKLSNIFDITV